MNKTKTVSSNINGQFLIFLTILFIALKLTGHIAWSWIWVVSPLWLPLAITLGFGLAALGIAGIFLLFVMILVVIRERRGW